MLKRQGSKSGRREWNYISQRTFDYVDGRKALQFFFSNLGKAGGYSPNTGKCSRSSGGDKENSVDFLKRVAGLPWWLSG